MGSKSYSQMVSRYSAFSPYRLINKELGFGNVIGSEDVLAKSFYCGMKPIASWDSEQVNILPTGGVFNLEFSPEGTLLVAACEKKSIQIFDPLTYKRIYTVSGAHSDCVNCVKFLDGRMFATCSDDTTIAIWDVRNLKKKIRSLLGHSNWVKNIEFSVKDKLLVTSGLDGSIYTWDINSYTEYNLIYQRVFHASGLMRCRLSPDAQQMVMCTTGGLLVIIHDLNLSTLAQDLHGFKPNLYRLMQMSGQLIPIAAMYDHLFDRKRDENRVEFVSDFPEGNEAEVVSALQIHPQGWTALSRNISHNDKSEWTCIHDIQADEPVSDKSTRDSERPAPPVAPAPRRPRRFRTRPYRVGRSRQQDSESNSESAQSDAGSGSPRPLPADSRVAPPAQPQPVSMQNDVWEASITIRQHRMVQEMASRGQVGRNFNMQRIMGVNTGIAPPPAAAPPPRLARRSRSDPASAAAALTPAVPDRPSTHAILVTGSGSGGGGSSGVLPSTSGHTPRDHKLKHCIRQNRDRLLYYVEETNEGKGFIKELCYSADGRLVCSPFGRGMRLLALNDACSELSHCIHDQKPPVRMTELGQSLGIHQDLVVSSKFSPRHHLLVTGCLEGKIVWYSPFSGESLY